VAHSGCHRGPRQWSVEQMPTWQRVGGSLHLVIRFQAVMPDQQVNVACVPEDPIRCTGKSQNLEHGAQLDVALCCAVLWPLVATSREASDVCTQPLRAGRGCQPLLRSVCYRECAPATTARASSSCAACQSYLQSQQSQCAVPHQCAPVRHQ
jgi:hypothetical protein